MRKERYRVQKACFFILFCATPVSHGDFMGYDLNLSYQTGVKTSAETQSVSPENSGGFFAVFSFLNNHTEAEISLIFPKC